MGFVGMHRSCKEFTFVLITDCRKQMPQGIYKNPTRKHLMKSVLRSPNWQPTIVDEFNNLSTNSLL